MCGRDGVPDGGNASGRRQRYRGSGSSDRFRRVSGDADRSSYLAGVAAAAAVPAEQHVQDETQNRGEEDDDGPQERRVLAVLLGVPVDPAGEREEQGHQQQPEYQDGSGATVLQREGCQRDYTTDVS